MFLVGASIPKMDLHSINFVELFWAVLLITILSNIGKLFPAFCYKNEATFRERLALSIAMFPRGEVGAGTLILALQYNLNSKAITIGALSLMLNLLLTGVFIWIVVRLLDVPHLRK